MKGKIRERKRKKKKTALFICEELGGVGGHKIADEFQREKNVFKDFATSLPAIGKAGSSTCLFP